MMKFAVNCGSSSIKFSLYDSNCNPVATGSAKDILGPTASISITNLVSPTAKSLKLKIPQTTTYQEVFTKLIRELSTEHDLSHLDLIAHRIVHGGSCLSPIVLHDLSDKHLQEMDEVSTFAPLHNHHAMLIVRACLEKFPLVRNVLAFDTLFHQTIPEFRYTYAVAKNDNPSVSSSPIRFSGRSDRATSDPFFNCAGTNVSLFLSEDGASTGSVTPLYLGR